MSGRFGPSALLIFLAALAVRTAHIWSMRRSLLFQTLLGDAGTYDAWAQQIASGNWIGREV